MAIDVFSNIISNARKSAFVSKIEDTEIFSLTL